MANNTKTGCHRRIIELNGYHDNGRPNIDKLANMKHLYSLAAKIDLLNRQIGRHVIWLVLIAVLISAANAVTRKFFNLSSNALLELQWVLFAAIFLLSAPYALQTNAHVRIDILTNRLSARARVWIELFGTLLFLLPMTILLAVLSWPVFVSAFQSGEASSNAGGLLLWPARLLVPLGFSLLSLQGISQAIKCLRFLKGQGADPTVSTQAIAPEIALADAILQHRDNAATKAL